MSDKSHDQALTHVVFGYLIYFWLEVAMWGFLKKLGHETRAKMFVRNCSFAIVFAATATSAYAELNADQALRDYRRSDPKVLLYVSGIGLGYEWANAELEARKQTPLYCAPPRLTIATDQFFDILRRSIEKDPEKGKSLVGLALLKALQDTFPCTSTK